MSNKPLHAPRAITDKTSVDWFKDFNPEEEKSFEKFKVTRNEMCVKIEAAWFRVAEIDIEGLIQSCDPNDLSGDPSMFPIYYKIAKHALRLNCSSSEIALASKAFQTVKVAREYFEVRAALFISALINNSIDDVVLLNTKLPGFANLYGLGCANTRKIIVKGDVGDEVGSGMKSGEIIIEGNAGDRVGYESEGGIIRIKGNAGEDVGGMSKGATYIEGEYLSLGTPNGGSIFHKGRRLR